MRIEVWADVLSPETRSAKEQLEAALAGRDGVEVVWRPHPSDDTDAQRLVHLAYADGGPALQGAVVAEVLAARYDEGEDITDPDVLARVSDEAGFAQGAAMLGTEAGRRGVDEQRLRGRVIGVKVVPTFTQADRMLEGADPDELSAFLDADEERAVPEETQRLRHAEALLGRRDPLGALRLIEPLLRDHPGHPDVVQLAARAYFKSAQLNKALVLAEAMVEVNPADFFARRLLGRTLERLGRSDEARAHLRLVDKVVEE
ncbi:DsbA family protein [Glycomyces sp. L485]|uniref:DsbA family protein n=1 Tax=Glycomyces sp. L485 TaxID=2909235 RepID=UPI001F4B23B6|nr:DsbA family protein [Glycomyces sp. L485]MCH7231820.1 DsbA family protein [Glycomyces sp. L485]